MSLFIQDLFKDTFYLKNSTLIKKKREYPALIHSGQMTRDEALYKLRNENPISGEQAEKDKKSILKKLGLTNKDFEQIYE